ncbi:MAG TPA: hypothetical protein PKX80_05375 [Flexilinea sp.]|jgi:hypothetical protein|nr:hypothetical protein [Flexilinea sp.]HOG60122.1 hypothetical protein [Flexilinea sp.]HPG19704.1 hypothetical protein [Flexilinea sp.]HQG88925.1 hypothetical protein [Flexilinea sp.]HQJ01036.1 hypothetical protein [Flexilinea sp.]
MDIEETQPIRPKRGNPYVTFPDFSPSVPAEPGIAVPTELNRESESRFVPPPYPPVPVSPEMAKALSAEIKSRKIQFLTHFTRLENLASILTYGLLPPNQLKSEGRTRFVRFNPPYLPGYWQNAISFNISFPNYRLFYNLQEQRGYDWVVLLFDINILLSQPFYYFIYPAANLIHTPIFATEISPKLQTFEAFEELFQDTENVRRAFLQIPDCYPTHPQSEVLTFQPVSVNALLEVHFYNDYKFNQWFMQNTALAMTMDKNIWQVSLEFFSPRCDYLNWKSTQR